MTRFTIIDGGLAIRPTAWLVVAQIGPPRDETDGYLELNTIVMAERATEREAENECRLRNARNDRRYYFVMSADEYASACGRS